MSTRVKELDALRGIAAVSVFLFHATLKNKQHFQFTYGVTAVDLFFLISGYVIYLSVEKVDNWQSFLINRLARLYPTYWLCVTFSFIVLLSQEFSFKWFKVFLLNLTMFQFYFRQIDIEGPYWTLIVEMIFYLFVLVLIRFKLTQKIEFIGILGLCLCIVYAFYSKKISKTLFYLLDYTLLIKHFPLFFSGIVFYRIQKLGLKTLHVITLIAAYLIQLSLFRLGGKSQFFITLEEYIPILFLYYAVFFTLIFRKLSFLNVKPLLFLGSISYPLYLIHERFAFSVLVPNLMSFNVNYWISIGVSLVIIVGLSYLITRYYEGAAIKRFKSFLTSK